MTHRHLIVVVAVTMIALAPTTQARADMGPPEPPTGSSIETGEPSTYVQMVSEEVLITIGDDSADVKAIFHMQNKGMEDEILDARFPVGFMWDSHQILGVNTDTFIIFVDGKRTNFTIDHQPDTVRIWATWPVTFPPKQGVTVEVTYQTPKSEGYSFPAYDYTLETGAGWYDTIGEGTITIRLPYEVNEENLYHIDTGQLIVNPDYYKIVDTDIVWHFANLEPTQEDNIYVKVMAPPLWREWQAAKKTVEEEPDSVSAHLRLAHAMSEITDYYNGACYGLFEYGRKAVDEYAVWLNVIPDEYALQKIPNIVDYHLDYIELLTSAFFNFYPVCPEVERVVALAPTNKRVLELRARLEASGWFGPDGWCSEEMLNPTPTLYAPPGCDPLAGRCPPPTATPTTTPRPTSTPRPTQTPTLAPTLTAAPPPTPQPPIPNLTLGALVGIAAVVIVGAGIGMWAARKKTRPAGD